MDFFTWNDTYSVKISEIDTQHKKIISLINQLYEAMHAGRGRDVLGEVLRDLVSYTVFHFSTEEKLFQQYHYPGQIRHKIMHDELAAKAKEFKKKFDQGEQVSVIDVLGFLRAWLEEHIIGEDKKYAPFLKEKGVH